MPRNYVQEPRKPVVQGPWAPQGPDPKGVSFLPMDSWAGIVDGYVFKTTEQGTGYYKNGHPTRSVKETDEGGLVSPRVSSKE